MAWKREKVWALILLVFVCVCQVSSVHGVDCKSEVRTFVNACKALVYGNPPTQECCAAIRTVHTECICPKITPRLAALIDVKRAVKIVQGCGRHVPRHYKCGSEFSFP
ncbi:hypothetical protein AMTR_s00071p00157560 [Amborella trichopoda]|uniref:Bifunctional inhibitor/plant lipid transfer protein/seed storage helical domain-containing protein n=1 Tax=Amborella trichopoda TaxID=13333 RepID=U5DBU7_AMBTC|nr:hypothetical protein AMTR_s00071p00157560 [Amborella trichopoda]